MADEILFAQVLDSLLTEKYRRNRSALAEAAHVSPSALSQYTRRKATPSLEVLVHLADALGVSLDYLVFGRERQAAAPEGGYLARHVETALRLAETRSATISDLVSRTGARLGETIRQTVEDVMNEDPRPGGLLNDTEVTYIERCSLHTTIMTTTLDMDVSILHPDDGGPRTSPSLFGQLIADNIVNGSRYDYFLPDDSELDQPAAMLENQLVELCPTEDDYLPKHFRIFRVSTSCVPGFVLYELSSSKLRRLDTGILERLSPFLHSEPSNDSIVYAATIEPVSRSYQYFALMQVSRVQRLLAEVLQRRSSLTSV